MPKLLIERLGVVTLFTVNRPEVHDNVDQELAVELADAIIALGAHPDAKVLVVTGAGDRSFFAGGNLKGHAGAVRASTHALGEPDRFREARSLARWRSPSTSPATRRAASAPTARRPSRRSACRSRTG